MRKPVICLMGPTASGKTPLAMSLTQHFPFEIISVDSAMVYRGMDIGTAKPNQASLQQAPHRLINIRDPKDAYSAGDFCDDAKQAITDIFAHQKIPLLVGGTMLYFKALQFGLATMPKANAALRQQLQARAQQEGWSSLHKELEKIDPAAAKRIAPQDSQRISRALEIYLQTGQTITSLQMQHTTENKDLDFINIAIAPGSREWLHRRIAERFDAMLHAGLVEEVQQLYARGDLSEDLPAIRSVGYREVWGYLSGEYDFATMQDKAINKTRQLAKRQLTWLRTWPKLQWFASEDIDLLAKVTTYLEQPLHLN